MVNFLIDENLITPIRNKMNMMGKVPSLYMKYKIVENKEEVYELEDEIKHLLPDFKAEKYLNHIDKYKEHRKIILKLDNFLKNSKEKLNIKLPKMKEHIKLTVDNIRKDENLVENSILENAFLRAEEQIKIWE